MFLDSNPRRKSMEIMLKPFHSRLRILPRLHQQQQQRASKSHTRQPLPAKPEPPTLDSQIVKAYKKPILFQLNFDINSETIVPRKALEREGRLLLRRVDATTNSPEKGLIVMNVGSHRVDKKTMYNTSISDINGNSSPEVFSETYNSRMTSSMVASDHINEDIQKSVINNQSTIDQSALSRSKHSTTAQKRKNLNFDNRDDRLKFYVGPGNNGQLVKKVLETRPFWAQTSESNSIYNFRWTQTTQGIKFDRLDSSNGRKQVVNHFQFHQQISTKSGLLRNLRTYCQRQQRAGNLFDITPLTFEVDFRNDGCEEELKRFLHFFLENNPSRKNMNKQQKKEDDRKTIQEFIRSIRHIHNIQSLTYEKKEHPKSKPVMKDIYSDSNTNSYLWLLKPTGLNRGRGIYLFKNLEELVEALNELYPEKSQAFRISSPKRHNSATHKTEQQKPNNPNANIRAQSFVLQKYIEKPMLIHNRKYDIRVWVLVTHEMELYFFKEGYVRTSCEKYSLESSDLYVHLTNNAVQKYSANYGTFQQGNQLGFEQLEKIFLEQQEAKTASTQSEHAGGKKVSFKQDILPSIKNMALMAMDCVKIKLNQNERKYSFELFGLDFMVDHNYKAWLIEVNTNPCIEESSPLLQRLVPRMLDNAFNLTIDCIFNKRLVSSSFRVEGYGDSENMWEWLGSLKTEKKKR